MLAAEWYPSLSPGEFNDLCRALSAATRGCSGISLEMLASTPLPPTLLPPTLFVPTLLADLGLPERDTHDEWRELNGDA